MRRWGAKTGAAPAATPNADPNRGGRRERRTGRRWLSVGARLGPLARRDSLAILILVIVLAIFFALTSWLVAAYGRKRATVGEDWYAAGERDLGAGRPAAAVPAFQNALAYAPDDFARGFALARALAATGRNAEAENYFQLLWRRAPQSGPVNLALARLAAKAGRTEDVLRFYHNAVYGIWSSAEGGERETARGELIAYLLRNGALGEADAEILAELPELPATAAARAAAGRQLLAAGDEEHALQQFRLALRRAPDNAAALNGAGVAAYRLGNYALAHRYLARAPAAAATEGMLRLTGLVLDRDPYAYHLSTAERRARARADFQTALARLADCAARLAPAAATKPPAAPAAAAATTSRGSVAAPSGAAALAEGLLRRLRPRGSTSAARATAATPPKTPPPVSSLADLEAQSQSLRRLARRGRLFRAPDAVPKLMDWVFQVEERTARTCGTPNGADLALLLIARRQEGSGA